MSTAAGCAGLRRPCASAACASRSDNTRSCTRRLEVTAGIIHALVGGNGSGKSTLIKILAGVYSADSGSNRGRRTTTASCRARSRWPLRRSVCGSFTRTSGIFPDLSVAENLALGHGYVTNRCASHRLVRRAPSRGRADRAVRHPRDATTPMTALGPADHAMIAIARGAAGSGARSSGHPGPGRADRAVAAGRGRRSCWLRSVGTRRRGRPSCSSAIGSTRCSASPTR